MTRATPAYRQAVHANTIALGVGSVALVIGGLVWSSHCAALEDAPGEVRTRGPPTTMVVEHGGYRPERLLIDHQSGSVQVAQARAWGGVATVGAIDVYAGASR